MEILGVPAARLAGTAVFLAATAVLVTVAAVSGVRGFELRDPLRQAFSAISGGFAAALLYEAYAYGTGRSQTISGVVAGEFLRHPFAYLAIFVPLCALWGALSFHFVNLPRNGHWWVFAVGGLAYVAGGALTWRTGWMP